MEKEDKQIWETYYDIAFRNRIKKVNSKTAYLNQIGSFFIRNKTMKTAAIIMGIQGSGKSEFFRRYLSDSHVRINLDTLKTSVQN